MKNRIIAFLTLIFLLSSTVTIGTVHGVDDSFESKNVQLISELGIMGTDEKTGMFWDNTPVERREMAMILCNIFKLEPITDASPRFVDVPEDEREYIETAVRNGYMVGYSDTRFAPRECITGEQLAKIFVTVLGGKPMAEVLGGFPQGYIQAAKKFGLFKNYSGALSDTARRIDVANIIAEALEADIMVTEGVSNDGGIYRIEEGATFLTEVLNIYRYEGIINQNAFTSLDSPDGADEDRVTVGEQICYDKEHIAEDYLGYYVTAYVHIPHKGEIGDVIYADASDNRIVEVKGEDYIGTKGTIVTYRDGDKQKNIEMSYVCDMIYNGKAVEYSVDKFSTETGDIKFVDNNRDGKYDVAVINDYTTYVAEKVNATDEIIAMKYGAAPLRLAEDIYRVYRMGEEVGLEDIASGEVLFAAVSEPSGGKRAIKIHVTEERAIGTVETTRVDGDGKTILKISGKDYAVSEYCEGLMELNYINEIKAGDSGQFFLGLNGEIAYFDADAAVQKVGYMIDAAFEKGVFTGSLTLKIYTDEGQIKSIKSEDIIRLNGEKTEVGKINEELFEGGQLIEYHEKDGVLTEVNLAANGSSYDNFSLDFSGNLRCVSKSVLGYKYITSASTKVFRVPSVPVDTENYDGIMENSALYQNLTGTFFNGGTTYTVKLYDFNEYNEAKYAVVTYNPFAADIWYNYAMLLITEVSEGVENGEDVVILKGLNEKGAEETLVCTSRAVIMDTGLKREPVKGDILQYRNGSDGKLAQIIIQHDVKQGEYYMPKSLDRAIDGLHVTKAFGRVVRNDGMNIAINCGGESEFDFVVRNTNGVVYRYNKERKIISQIDFSDVEPESNAFACCNYEGLRMIVVVE